MEITELKAKLFDIQQQIMYLQAAQKQGLQKLRELVADDKKEGKDETV